MTQHTERNMDPKNRGLDDQNQVVNQEDQNLTVNPGPRENAEKSQEDTLIDHSFEKEGYERTNDPEIETPLPKEDNGADSTEKKIPNF